MPRATWRGFLRLSLVSCPIYLSPAASRTKPIRLRQVWRPEIADEGGQSPEAARPKQVTEPSLPDLGRHDGGYDADQPQPVTRVTIRPHDPRTGEEIDKAEVRGQTPIAAMLILLHRDRPVTFVKGVREFGTTAIHWEPLHQII
jgi:hypothetical protein